VSNGELEILGDGETQLIIQLTFERKYFQNVKLGMKIPSVLSVCLDA